MTTITMQLKTIRPSTEGRSVAQFMANDPATPYEGMLYVDAAVGSPELAGLVVGNNYTITIAEAT